MNEDLKTIFEEADPMKLDFLEKILLGANRNYDYAISHEEVKSIYGELYLKVNTKNWTLSGTNLSTPFFVRVEEENKNFSEKIIDVIRKIIPSKWIG